MHHIYRCFSIGPFLFSCHMAPFLCEIDPNDCYLGSVQNNFNAQHARLKNGMVKKVSTKFRLCDGENETYTHSFKW